MSGLISFSRRIWAAIYPTTPTKTQDAVRIGLLGASTIAPMAIIMPAKSHPEVIIAAIAARDEEKGKAYAKKHGIPIVHKSYQDLIDDPAIDAVYIPLPNGLHYEWALKSLKAGKHVLLEKPSTSNATEAARLFRNPLLKQPNAPVLLEAFHSRFHPAWQSFLSHLDPKNIVYAHSQMTCPKYVFSNTNIRFLYDLSGGTLMDAGAYPVLFMRLIFGTEPEECLEATPRLMPKGFDQRCDQAMKAKWKFPNGGIGTILADLSATGWGGLPSLELPRCEVLHGEVVIDDDSLENDSVLSEHVVVKTVTIWNMVMPVFWHRIDILEHHTIRTIAEKKTLKTWATTKQEKAYTWQDGDAGKRPEDNSWSTYRHQLEQFINKVKRRDLSGAWMDGEDSVRQMEMIDSAYTRAGLQLRPTSSYQ